MTPGIPRCDRTQPDPTRRTESTPPLAVCQPSSLWPSGAGTHSPRLRKRDPGSPNPRCVGGAGRGRHPQVARTSGYRGARQRHPAVRCSTAPASGHKELRSVTPYGQVSGSRSVGDTLTTRRSRAPRRSLSATGSSRRRRGKPGPGHVLGPGRSHPLLIRGHELPRQRAPAPIAWRRPARNGDRSMGRSNYGGVV